MAGLGETCTHVAACLFYLEAAARLQESATCTGKPCEWKLPTFQKTMDYAAVSDIDFSSAKRRRQEVESPLPVSPGPDAELQASAEVRRPNAEERNLFFDDISHCGVKPAILSLVPPFSDKYVPKSAAELPSPLTSLFEPPRLEMSQDQLRDLAASVAVVVTDKQAAAVEKATRGQSKSRIWFSQRAGRVTASKMHQVVKAGPSPASLVKSICYPEEMAFMSAATSWGKKQEGAARARYAAEATSGHPGLTITDSGLVINPTWPWLGASPDGLLSCQCCGLGVLEVKCPYSHRGRTLAEAVESTQPFCLEAAVDGTLQLQRSHAYYAQVQTQLHVCDVEYCDFCVCLFAAGRAGDLHVERIFKDTDFWEDCLAKAEATFQDSILPELLGKWFTSSSRRAVQSASKSVAAAGSPVPSSRSMPSPTRVLRHASPAPPTAARTTARRRPATAASSIPKPSPSSALQPSTLRQPSSGVLQTSILTDPFFARRPLPTGLLPQSPAPASATSSSRGTSVRLLSSPLHHSITAMSPTVHSSRSQQPSPVIPRAAGSGDRPSAPLSSSTSTVQCCTPTCMHRSHGHLTLHQCCQCLHKFHHMCSPDESGRRCICCTRLH